MRESSYNDKKASDELMKKLSGKEAELKKIAASKEGAAVEKMLSSRPDLEAAAKSGDFGALKGAVGEILATDDGRQLLKQLGDLMKQI